MTKAIQRNKAILSTMRKMTRRSKGARRFFQSTQKMNSFDNAKDGKGDPKEQGDSFDNAKDDKGDPKEQGDSFVNAKDEFFRQRKRWQRRSKGTRRFFQQREDDKAIQRSKAILLSTQKMNSFDNAKDDKGDPKEQGDSFNNAKDDKAIQRNKAILLSTQKMNSFDNAKDDKGDPFREKANLSTT